MLLIVINLIMSFTRRLKIRSVERHSQRDAIHLVFARADYDCRRQVPRSLPYKKWTAAVAHRFGVNFNP